MTTTYNVSKLLKVCILPSKHSLSLLFDALKPTFLYPASGVYDKEASFDHQDFITTYQSFLETFLNREPLSEIQQALTFFFTQDPSCIQTVVTSDDRVIYKPKTPLILIRPYFLSYLEQKNSFLEMTYGKQAFFFGLQFSFPMLFQDPSTLEVIETRKMNLNNFKAFQTLQKYARKSLDHVCFQKNMQLIHHHCKVDAELKHPVSTALEAYGVKLYGC